MASLARLYTRLPTRGENRRSYVFHKGYKYVLATSCHALNVQVEVCQKRSAFGAEEQVQFQEKRNRAKGSTRSQRPGLHSACCNELPTCCRQQRCAKTPACCVVEPVGGRGQAPSLTAIWVVCPACPACSRHPRASDRVRPNPEAAQVQGAPPLACCLAPALKQWPRPGPPAARPLRLLTLLPAWPPADQRPRALLQGRGPPPQADQERPAGAPAWAVRAGRAGGGRAAPPRPRPASLLYPSPPCLLLTAARLLPSACCPPPRPPRCSLCTWRSRSRPRGTRRWACCTRPLASTAASWSTTRPHPPGADRPAGACAASLLSLLWGPGLLSPARPPALRTGGLDSF